MENHKNPSIKDIAARANVSLGTVDRVIHKRSGVSKKTKEKVQQIIEQLKYKPNVLASNLAKKKVLKLAVLFLFDYCKTSQLNQWLIGIEKAKNEIEKFSIEIEIDILNSSKATPNDHLFKNIEKGAYDGLIIFSLQLNEKFKCLGNKLPYVLIGDSTNESEVLCQINPNHFESGKLAGQLFNYLLKDKEKILIVSSKGEDSKGQGLLQYLQETGSQITTEIMVIENDQHQNIENKLDIFFLEHKNVKGIFSTSVNTSRIAKYISEKSTGKIHLIGVDFHKQNEVYLDNGIIDFLICQKLENQSFMAVQNMFKHIVLKEEIAKKIGIPIDIITKQNYKFY